jgi:hypothetical protein
LQNHDADVQKTGGVERDTLSWNMGVGRYTPDDWEFGVSRSS